MQILFCKRYYCDLGAMIQRRFPLKFGFDLLFQTDVIGKCTRCVFDSGCTESISLCNGESDLLLVANPSLSCTNEIYKYFLPGSILMLVGFTMGVPVLYFRLVKKVSKFLRQIRVTENATDDKWLVQSSVSKNSCSSLYNSFKMEWKYYKLLLMLYRLLIVLIFVFLTALDFTLGTSIFLFLAHFSAFAFSIYSHPYSDKAAQFLFYTVIVINIGNCALVIMRAAQIYIDNTWLPVIVFINTCLPTLMFFIGYLLDRKRIRKLYAKSIEFNGKPPPEGLLHLVIDADRAKIKTMDAILNRKLLNIALNYFVILGIISSISGSIGLLGIVSQDSALKVRSDTRIQGPDIVQSEFGSFYSWKEFTDNCCCMLNLSDQINGIENWKCNNNLEFQFKTLIRAGTDVNGYDVRPFCGRVYNFVRDPAILNNGNNVFYTVHGDFLPGYSRDILKAAKNWNDEQIDAVLLYLW